MGSVIFWTLTAGYLPVATCLWIGVLGLHKDRSARSLLCMRIGAILFTIGTLGISVAMIAMESGGSEFRISPRTVEYAFTVHAAGLFLFAIGFAFHGTRSGRTSDRITELEMMNLAQATELERLRDR